MEQHESIHAMYTRFTDIINSLKALGKSFSNSELVKKTLRSLMDYEDKMYDDMDEVQKNKLNAFKSTKYDDDEEEKDESDEDEDEEVAQMTRSS
ncbi:UBN2 domain-containing protein [Melia azedarach]|uniref:UBN2 domain-containing protein n=1 Tax=Melia azedarach TaxID=155640 RepID=A0ACC1X0W4_MELAZ|nr:UBN2 domain-containing protein [Melia azedarach]